MNIKYIFFIIVFSSFSHASVNVSLFENGTATGSLALPDSSRLSDLLHDERLPPDIYWRSAQLTNMERMNASEAERKSLVSELISLKESWNSVQRMDLAASTQKLIDDLSRGSVSGHFNLEIDPDLSRIDKASNPLLKGDYILFFSARKPYLNLIGLTESSNQQGLYPGVGIHEYWQGYHLLPGADPAFIYMIQPTGKVDVVPVAIWNRLHREPMAGATLFIGFDPDILPPDHKSINARIAKLMTNRIPQ